MSSSRLLVVVDDDTERGGAGIRCRALTHAVTELGGRVFRVKSHRAAAGCSRQCTACRPRVPGKHPFDYAFCQNAVNAMRAQLDEFQPSAVVVSDLRLACYANVVREHGTRLVLDLHNAEADLASQITRTPEFRSATPDRRAAILRSTGVEGSDASAVDRIREVEASLVKAATVVTVVSPEDAAAITRTYAKDAVHVLPNTVRTGDARDLVRWPPQRARRLVFTATLDYLPNLVAARALVRDVLPVLREQVRGSSVVIAGRNPPEDLVELCEGNPDVRLVANPPAVADLIGSGVSISYLSVGGGSRLKVLQAFEAGVPVISTITGASGTSAEPGRHYLNVDSPADVAQAVRRIESHPEEDLRRRVEARRLVREEYSWHAFGRSLRKMIERYL